MITWPNCRAEFPTVNILYLVICRKLLSQRTKVNQNYKQNHIVKRFDQSNDKTMSLSCSDSIPARLGGNFARAIFGLKLNIIFILLPLIGYCFVVRIIWQCTLPKEDWHFTVLFSEGWRRDWKVHACARWYNGLWNKQIRLWDLVLCPIFLLSSCQYAFKSGFHLSSYTVVAKSSLMIQSV